MTLTHPQTDSSADDTEVLRGPFYVDAHIHIYHCFDEARMLDAAAANVAGYDKGEGTGVLALTETSQFDVFRRWRDEGVVGPWRLRGGLDPAMLIAERDGGGRLIILAGRQIVTEGRLGVLALGADASYPDGKPVEASIGMAREAGAVPVVSFGIGKWHLRRGRLVDDLIASAEPGELGLGDIAARPLIPGYTPRQFRDAAERGLTILPGSDPLILCASQDVVCSYCTRVDGEFPIKHFVRDFMAHLRCLGPAAPRYGRHLSLAPAVYRQVAMQLARKRYLRQGLPI